MKVEHSLSVIQRLVAKEYAYSCTDVYRDIGPGSPSVFWYPSIEEYNAEVDDRRTFSWFLSWCNVRSDAPDSSALDLIGDDLFKTYLHACTNHEDLTVHFCYKRGRYDERAPFIKYLDVARTLCDLPKIQRFCAARGLETATVLNQWQQYLQWDNSHGVFMEYLHFNQMWGTERVPTRKLIRGNLFLEVLFGYAYERMWSDKESDMAALTRNVPKGILGTVESQKSEDGTTYVTRKSDEKMDLFTFSADTL